MLKNWPCHVDCMCLWCNMQETNKIFCELKMGTIIGYPKHRAVLFFFLLLGKQKCYVGYTNDHFRIIAVFLQEWLFK